MKLWTTIITDNTPCQQCCYLTQLHIPIFHVILHHGLENSFISCLMQWAPMSSKSPSMCPSSLHIFSAAGVLSFMWFPSTSFPESFAYHAKTLILSFFTVKAFSFHPTGYLLPLYKVQDEKGVSGNPTIVNHLEMHQRCPSLLSFWSLPRVEVLMPKPPHPSSHSSSTCHNTPLLSTTTLGTSQGGGREE